MALGLKPETIEYLKRRAGRAPMLGRRSLRGRGSQMLHRHGGPNRMRAMGRARIYLAKSFPEALVLSIVEKRKQPMIFGLTGPSGVGKTEILKHLMDEHGFVSTHAGRPVKKALKKGFKLSQSQVDGKHKGDAAQQLGGIEPKLVLDHVGEAIAQHAPHATAIALGHRIDKMRRTGHSAIVVDGIRQQAEADLIHRRGGHMIRADDGRGPNPMYPMDKRAAQIKVDHQVDTSGPLEKTYDQMRKIVADVKANSPSYIGKDMDAGDVHIPTAIGNDRKRKPRRALYPQLSLAAVPNMIQKRDFSAKRRRRLAAVGAAMPGGRYPITSPKDVHNAIALIGHSSDKDAVRAHIIARARAIGATGALPDDWVSKRVGMILKNWQVFDAARVKVKTGPGSLERAGSVAGLGAGLYHAPRIGRLVRGVLIRRGIQRIPAAGVGAIAGYAAIQGARVAGGYVGRKVDQVLGKNGGRDKVHQVMHEYKHGQLRSGSKTGPKVRSRGSGYCDSSLAGGTVKPMTIRFNGGSTPGSHCTHCPMPIGATCSLPCGKEYSKLQKERATDGVKVREEGLPSGWEDIK